MKPWSITSFREVTSTMDEARRLLRDGAPEGLAVVAESQTQGRGRRGRVWHSQPGAGLWMTVLLRPRERTDFSSLTLVVGLAVLKALQGLGLKEPRLKWPNDLVARGRKLAGILVEAETSGSRLSGVLVGIGINLLEKDRLKLPADIEGRYVGVRELEGGSVLAANSVQEAVMSQLQEHYREWSRDGFASLCFEWNRWDALRDRRISARIGTEIFSGLGGGADKDGALIMITDKGRQMITAGEVTWAGEEELKFYE